MKTPMMTSKKLPVHHRLIKDMSNQAYHSAKGTWSSTQFKTILDDEEVFIQTYVKGLGAKIEGEALDTGTYFHVATLEPHKVHKEIVVFEGKTRYGSAWSAFKEKHADKCIITAKQKELGDRMVTAVKASPSSMEYLKGEPEVSLFTEIRVAMGEIYAPYFSKKMTRDGWVTVKKVPKDGFNLSIKVRADCLGETFVSDLKSTSGRANKGESVRGSISTYKYDLSASLYLDMFSLIREDVTEFIWIFASKENSIAVPWRATKKNILIGRAKWMWAVKRLAELSDANWEQADYLREAEPLPHELEWLDCKDTDLL